ncbi:hypothetical protein HA402_008274, partial [Bradysia odoriphaga]
TNLSDVEKEILRQNICNLIKNGKITTEGSKISKIIKKLTSNNEIVILKADKGNCTVVMNRQDYHNKINQLLQEGPYEKLSLDPTQNYLQNLKNQCKILKDNRRMSQELHKEIINHNPRTSKFFRLPKTHKEGLPFRPINDYRNLVYYKLAKFLNKHITISNQNSQSSVKNSYGMLNDLRKIQLHENEILVSFDVKSLYTNLSIEATIGAVKERLEEDQTWKEKLNENLTTEDMTDLLRTCLSNTYFQYNNEYCLQKDGCPMGLPISGTAADNFLQKLERDIVKDHPKIRYWKRYVDDVLAIIDKDSRKKKTIKLHS